MASKEIEELLNNYSQTALVQMAAFHGLLPKQSKSKAILTRLLAGLVADPQHVREEPSKMYPAERAALDAILRRGGKTSVRNIRTELSRMNLIDPALPVQFGEYAYKDQPDPRAQNSKRLEDILSRLMIRGLVYSDDKHDPADPYAYGYQTKQTFYDAVSKVFIPDTIRRYLPAPEPLPTKEESLPELKTVQEGSARVFQRELYLYWSYVRDHPVALTMKNEIAKQALKDLNNLLLVRGDIQTGKTENDYPRLRFLRGMLSELGLVREKGQVEAGPGDFFALDPAERVKQTYQKWLKTDDFNELLLLPDDVRTKGTAAAPLIPAKPGLVKARDFIIEQVGKLKRTDWIAMDTLVDRINDLDYEFLFRRRAFSGYYGTGVINPYEYIGLLTK